MRKVMVVLVGAMFLGIVGCAASGYRFHAGVDVAVSKIVRDSTRTTQVTTSGPDKEK